VQRVPTSENGALDGQIRRAAVLTAGAPVPEPSTFLQSRAMTELLAGLRHNELVIIDASPIARRSDAISLLRRVDGVLITAPLNASRGADAQQLRTQLSALDAHVIGVTAMGGGKRPGGYVQADRAERFTALSQWPPS
jgi:Mrp family chromosome partitioning ATPase